MVFPDETHLVARMRFSTAFPYRRSNRATPALAETETMPATRRAISKHSVPSCIGLLTPQ